MRDAALTAAQASDTEVVTAVLELREFALEFCDGCAPEAYNADTRRALALVNEADGYLVATPVYRACYTGALKNLFDLIPNDAGGNDPLRGKVVGLMASGGSDHHYLVLEHQLRPLLSFFGSHTLARAVYANGGDFDPEKRITGRLREDLRQLGEEVVALTRLLQEGPTDFRPAPLHIRRT